MSASIRHWLPTLLLLLAGSAAHAQSGAAFDSSLVETGEAFYLHLTVQDAAGQPASVDFSPWDSIFPQQNILRQSGWRQVGDQWQNDVTLITFDSAELQLPPLVIRFRDGHAEETNPLAIQVLPTPSPDDPNDLADIDDIRREPFHWQDALPWVLLVGGLTALAALVWWLLVRRKKRGPRSRVLLVPPHELALRQLDALAQRNLWQNHQIKEYYDTLTHIVRQYLQQRYGVPALESVSDEILYHLTATDFPSELKPALSELLHAADLVKFAKGDPPAAFHEQAWQSAREFVVRTVPRVEAEVANH